MRHPPALVACFGDRVMGTPPSAAAFAATATATVTLETLDKINVTIHKTLVDSDDTSGPSARGTIEIAVNITNAGTTTLSAFGVSSSLLEGQLERFVDLTGEANTK